MSRRPDLFIVGAPKSGTTSLYEYLREHPEVFMSQVKEPMYFSPDVYRSWRDRFEHGRDEARYMQLFADARGEKRLGEASTHYLSSPRAPALIHAFQPDARIVCILRNPVEVAHAWHAERVFKAVEEAPELTLEMLQDQDSIYLHVGSYGSQLRRWFDQFGRDAVHVIVFDDFIADTPAEYARLLHFLEVEITHRPAAFAAHNASSAKSRLVPLLRARPVRVGARALKSITGEKLGRRLSQSIRRIRLFERRVPRPPMSDAVRRRLEAAYADEIRLAGELLSRDLAALWPPRSG